VVSRLCCVLTNFSLGSACYFFITFLLGSEFSQEGLRSACNVNQKSLFLYRYAVYIHFDFFFVDLSRSFIRGMRVVMGVAIKEGIERLVELFAVLWINLQIVSSDDSGLAAEINDR
jgi:Tfp pilus assembly protein PilZ